MGLPRPESVIGCHEVVSLAFPSVRVGSGCSVRRRRQSHSLLVHPLGLRAHDEAEEVLVWYGGPADWGASGRGAALVVQSGALLVEEQF